jgi:hypothetical protein
MAGLLVTLTACGSEPLPPEKPEAQVAKPSTPAPLKQFQFAGRWAVSPAMCTNGWWDFGADEIRTAGELGCSVTRDNRSETGAVLQLTCVGEGMPSVEQWSLQATEGGRMSVTRDKAPPVLLMRCPGS